LGPQAGDQVTFEGQTWQVEKTAESLVRLVGQKGETRLVESSLTSPAVVQVATSLFPGSTLPIVGEQVALIDRANVSDPGFFSKFPMLVRMEGQLAILKTSCGEVRDISILHLKRLTGDALELATGAVAQLVSGPVGTAIGEVADKLVIGGVALKQRTEA
jgi:hypothetical protein